MVEMYIQRYVAPNKGHRLLYRLTYFCHPERCRKANYVEILGPSDANNEKYWCYAGNDTTVMYKSYNGIAELERAARKVTHLASVVPYFQDKR